MSSMQSDVQTNKDENKNSTDEICEWIDTMLGAIFVVLIIFTFLFRQVRVDGSSMVPTLHNNDRLIVTNLFYKPDNEDIIVCSSKGLDKKIVKRIIAKEGQEINIDFDKGIVYVDGKQIYEPYINSLTVDPESAADPESGYTYPMKVPTGCYFVMGDNRGDSCDSRDARVGLVKKSDIVGKAVFRLFPFNKFGKLYD